jgi:predicted dehydrogenase
MGPGPLRWGVIGSGHIAGVFAQDMAVTASGRVVAVGSRTQEAADRFGDKFAVPRRHCSYEDLVSDPDVDAVYVATPHPAHRDNALLALDAGKPVLVEKAFTMNATEARQVVARAREKGLFLMEAMCTRFQPHMVEVARLVKAGALGEIVAVMADLGHRFPPDPASRFFAPELGGSVLLDCGVYTVAFASMVLGAPAEVRALVSPAFTGVDGQTSVLLGFRGGAHAVLTCNSAGDGPTRATIVGTEVRIEVDPPFYAPSRVTTGPRSGMCLPTPATVFVTKPTRSSVACGPGCWRARSCRSTRPYRTWKSSTLCSPRLRGSRICPEGVPGAGTGVSASRATRSVAQTLL